MHISHKTIGWTLVVAGCIGAGAWIFLLFFPKTPAVVRIDDMTYTLEIADTPAKQSLGLGERDELCQRCGMLFLFPDMAPRAFWMKGMRFPLDIAWLQDDTIVHIERSVSEESETVYRPDVAANRVLEFSAGTLANVAVGSRVFFSW